MKNGMDLILRLTFIIAILFRANPLSVNGSTLTITISDYSWLLNKETPLSLAVNIYGDHIAASARLCTELVRMTMPSSSEFTRMDREFFLRRCQVPLLLTLRQAQVENIMTHVPETYTLPWSEGEDWGVLTYLTSRGFTITSHSDTQNAVCIIANSFEDGYNLFPLLSSLPFVHSIYFLGIFSPDLLRGMKYPLSTVREVFSTTQTAFFHEIIHEQDDVTSSQAYQKCQFVIVKSEELWKWSKSAYLSLLQSLLSVSFQSLSTHQFMLIRDCDHHSLSSCSPTTLPMGLQWSLHSPWIRKGLIMSESDGQGYCWRMYHFLEDDLVRTVYAGKLLEPSSPLQTVQQVQITKENVVIMITFTVRIYAETAYGLAHLLRTTLGFKHVLVPAELTSEVMEVIEDMYGRDMAVLQIAVAPNDISSLLVPHHQSPRHHQYIVWHMEQSWNTHQQDFTSYRTVLRNAVQVWIFSEIQRSAVEQWWRQQHSSDVHSEEADTAAGMVLTTGESIQYTHQTHHPTVQIVPLATYLSSISDTDRDKLRQRVQKDYPETLRVLFLGICTDRRVQLLDMFDTLLRQTPSSSGVRVQLVRLCTTRSTIVMDNHRDQAVLSADLVVHIHATNTSVLETHRLLYLLGRGTCVVSEPGVDPVLTGSYANAVHFFPIGDMSLAVQTLHQLVTDRTSTDNNDEYMTTDGERIQYARQRLARCQERSKERYKQLTEETAGILERVMERALIEMSSL